MKLETKRRIRGISDQLNGDPRLYGVLLGCALFIMGWPPPFCDIGLGIGLGISLSMFALSLLSWSLGYIPPADKRTWEEVDAEFVRRLSALTGEDRGCGPARQRIEQ